jgi:phage shock protein E
MQKLSITLLAAWAMITLVMPASAADSIWIDVRTDLEFSQGHVEGAHHIPYGDIKGKITALTADKDQEIHLYCRSGNRSGKALNTLQSMGYRNAHNDGGINDLLHKAKLVKE